MKKCLNLLTLVALLGTGYVSASSDAPKTPGAKSGLFARFAAKLPAINAFDPMNNAIDQMLVQEGTENAAAYFLSNPDAPVVNVCGLRKITQQDLVEMVTFGGRSVLQAKCANLTTKLSLLEGAKKAGIVLVANKAVYPFALWLLKKAQQFVPTTVQDRAQAFAANHPKVAVAASFVAEHAARYTAHKMIRKTAAATSERISKLFKN